MQAHAPSGVEQLLFGNVAERVLRGAPVPVLLHHPWAAVGRAEAWVGRELSSCAASSAAPTLP
jgi:hypothetical protein